MSNAATVGAARASNSYNAQTCTYSTLHMLQAHSGASHIDILRLFLAHIGYDVPVLFFPADSRRKNCAMKRATATFSSRAIATSRHEKLNAYPAKCRKDRDASRLPSAVKLEQRQDLATSAHTPADVGIAFPSLTRRTLDARAKKFAAAVARHPRPIWHMHVRAPRRRVDCAMHRPRPPACARLYPPAPRFFMRLDPP